MFDLKNDGFFPSEQDTFSNANGSRRAIAHGRVHSGRTRPLRTRVIHASKRTAAKNGFFFFMKNSQTIFRNVNGGWPVKQKNGFRIAWPTAQLETG